MKARYRSRASNFSLASQASAELERAHSPHLNVAADSPPCFLVHAEDDDVVPVENSVLMRAALKAIFDSYAHALPSASALLSRDA